VSEEVVLLQGKESATDVISHIFQQIVNVYNAFHTVLSLVDRRYLICLHRATSTSSTLKVFRFMPMLVGHEHAGWMAKHELVTNENNT
jgi:hypothetical protein